MDVTVRADGVKVCPFPHQTQEFAQNFEDILDEVREVAPIVWSDTYDGGFWLVTAHEAARKLAIDAAAMSVAVMENEQGERKGGMGTPMRHYDADTPLFVPGEAEGEEHDNYRSALNPMFTKQRVAQMQGMVLRHVTQVIDKILAGDGTFDLAQDLMHPILAGISCEHLGLTLEDPAAFFHQIMVRGNDTEFMEAWQQIVAAVEERKNLSERPDDVISHLLEWKDPVFTDFEVQQMTFNVILGAHHTTMSLASQAFLYLDSHRDLRAYLAANPDKLPAAVEEFLRLFVVAIGVSRTVMEDREIAGVTLKKGQRVMLCLATANRDPAKYPNPREFDLERGASQHLGMGFGTHFCLGSRLAKSIMATSLREALTRLPDYTIDYSGIVTTGLNDYDHIPALVAPRA
jgi:cytochrome P450